jgi:mannose-6-phosphate isomerase
LRKAFAASGASLEHRQYDPMKLSPVRLEPVFFQRPWGALTLAPLFPEKSNLVEPIGEAWMTGVGARFAGGALAGRTLGEAWPEMTPEWIGTRVKHEPLFPLLVKFIFAETNLSVQVHPGDDYAARFEQSAGGRGKTEMWHILSARKDAAVFAGLKPYVTRASLERAVAEGTAENLLERVPMSAGDTVFIPAGTVHTIGAGLVLCEIQQNSDITYRLYDYNRRDAQGRARDLHLEKGLEVTHFGEQAGGKLNRVPFNSNGASEESPLVACRYFATEHWEFRGAVTAASSREHFDLLIFLEGKGTIAWGNADANASENDGENESSEYGPAQVWMLPAALGEYRLTPSSPTSLLRTYVPPSLDELSTELTGRGLSATQVSRLIHR